MSIRTLLSPVAAILVFLPSISLLGAVPGDEHWDAQFGAPGVSNTIYAVAMNNGLVYAAGATPVGVSTNTPLYVWDGKQWTVSAVFNGPSFNGPSFMQVNDLAFVGNTLYAAGSFTNVNGVAANGLAKWDGTSWSGMGFSGLAYALAVDGNNLYVGGLYTNAGGITITNIGYWDGNAWHALGDGLGLPGTLNYVRTMVIKNGMVYAGGSFTNSGSQLVTNLAVWNGVTWSAMVGGGINGQVNALAFNNNDLYVGGAFTLAGATPANSIAKWDGASWSALDSGLTGGSSAAVSIAILNGVTCVAGSFTAAGGIVATNFAMWNGSSWSGTAGALSATGYRAVVSGANLYVGGSFTVAGNVWVSGIALWDGTRWSPLGTFGRYNGVQATVTALANDGTNLYAGGLFNFAGQTNANYIARFDGKNWQPLGTGLNNRVDALAVTNNRVYAGGYFTGTADGRPLHYIGCWDGTNWNSIGDAGGLVYALAVSTNGLYAAGTYYTGTQYGSPFFNRWDGTNWYNALVLNPTNTFFAIPLSDSTGYDAIAIQGTNVYLGGNIQGFTQIDPNVLPWVRTNCLNIMRFDANYGWIMDTGVDGKVVAIAILGTIVYAAGSFTTAGESVANQIAQWNGTAWSNVSGSVVGSGTVLALTTLGNNLYAGGTFTNIGGVSANRIAKWDGTNWSALGSGTSGSVFSLTAIGSDLFAGGGMHWAGDKLSYEISHWNAQVNFNIPQLANPSWPSNKQFQVRLMGVSSLTNIIQASTNLNSWTPIFTNNAGIYDFVDPNSAGYPHRFYRAVLGP